MTFSQLVLSQFADPFRIALLVALVFTMMRNRAATGTLIPLAAGVVFVAVIIPTTIGATSSVPFWHQVGAGILSNAVILAVVLGIWEAVRRARGG